MTTQRPYSVTAVGWLFIATGALGLLFHLSEFRAPRTVDHGLLWATLVRVLAVVGGVFLLRGHNWARWLLVLWMAFHLVLSLFHSAREALVHTLLFGGIGYLLFRAATSAYVQAASQVEPRRNPALRQPTGDPSDD